MKYFRTIAENIDTGPILAQLSLHPELWNQHPERTYEGSPHFGVDDVWIRYRKFEELTSREAVIEPHFAEFYPAWFTLSELKPIVWRIMDEVRPVYLGGILMTRIPPGVSVKPHDDRGSWHSEFHNCKVYVCLKANENCVNYCGNEKTTIRQGQAVTFDNLVTHSVENNGEAERITLIICMRVEG